MRERIVFITGASAGIGAACARLFAAQGARLLLAARREEQLHEVAAGLGAQTHSLVLDVRNRGAVERAIGDLPAEWTAIDILVNNAGLARGLGRIHDAEIQDWEEMIDTNVKGLLYVSRAVIPGMINRGRGHVINIGSLAGHEVYPGGIVYCATKASVNSISQGMRVDLLGTPIRVTSVDPGLVQTDFSFVRFHGDADRAAKVYQGLQPLTPDDVADVVLFCATRPPHVDIADVILMPTAQASAQLVARRA